MRIGITLIERTVPYLRDLLAAIEKEFGAKVLLQSLEFQPTHSFDARRCQYNAEILLRELKPFKMAAEKNLFIFRDDIFVPGLNFVFGLACGSICILSTARLDPRFYGEKDMARAGQLFRGRLIKEALHELGHTFGLPHCDDKKCVMSFSNTIADVDEKGESFCINCRKNIH